jgi:hypothetical protein
VIRFVLGAVTNLLERHVTVLARERPLVGVHPHVHNQVLLQFERLAAQLAAELLVDVHPARMRLELDFTPEFTPTHIARNERIQMAHEMLGETRPALDHPLANVALVIFTGQVQPIDVLHQVRPVAELFAANAAKLGFAFAVLELGRACVVLLHVLQVVHVHLVVFSANIALERVHLEPRHVIYFLPGSLRVAEKMLLGNLFHAERRFATRALGVPPAVVFLHVLH